jgi:hypothetical protein
LIDTDLVAAPLVLEGQPEIGITGYACPIDPPTLLTSACSGGDRGGRPCGITKTCTRIRECEDSGVDGTAIISKMAGQQAGGKSVHALNREGTVP